MQHPLQAILGFVAAKFSCPAANSEPRSRFRAFIARHDVVSFIRELIPAPRTAAVMGGLPQKCIVWVGFHVPNQRERERPHSKNDIV
jgi:hypothetical protein